MIYNKKANFNYFFIDELVVGIQLSGLEVKSIKNGNVSLEEAFCVIKNQELFINGLYIAPYKTMKHLDYEPTRQRKLLANKKEIRFYEKSIKEKGLTLIPKLIFISDYGLIKLKIGLAKGKKTYNKKQALKEKDLERELKRKE